MIAEHRQRMATRVAAAALALVVGSAARADAIDGDWCYGALTLSIHGPRLVYPGGIEIVGRYTRHSFDFEPDANSPAAVAAMSMRLVNEETMLLSRAAAATETPETWRRCKPIS
jgi:hypothetical protein